MKDQFGPGYFWDPAVGIQGRKPGTLEWRVDGFQHGFVLESFGHIESDDSFRIGMSQTDPVVPVIHGIVQTVPVTLINARPIWMSFQRGFSQFRYHSDFVVRGHHMSLAAEEVPIGIEIHISNLADFLKLNELAQFEQVTPDDLASGNWSIEEPSGLRWNLDVLEVELIGRVSSERQRLVTVVTEDAFFRVHCSHGMLLDQWRDRVVVPLLDLLRFVSSSDQSIEKCRMMFPSHSKSENDTLKKQISAQLFINQKNLLIASESLDEPTEWLFHAQDLDSRAMDSILQNVEGNTLLSRLFQIEHSPINQDETLIQLVRQIESFHRRTRPVTSEVIAQHQTRINGLVAHVREFSSSDAKLVKRYLKYGYEPSLRERLLELTQPWSEEFLQILESKAQWNQMLSAIVDHRNYLAHGLPQEEIPLADRSLFEANNFLKILSRLLILSYWGWDDSMSWNLVQKTQVFDRWSQRIESSREPNDNSQLEDLPAEILLLLGLSPKNLE